MQPPLPSELLQQLNGNLGHFFPGPRWFTVPDNYEQPMSHVVLMIVLVVSAVIGSVATIYWTVANCKRRKRMQASSAQENSEEFFEGKGEKRQSHFSFFLALQTVRITSRGASVPTCSTER